MVDKHAHSRHLADILEGRQDELQTLWHDLGVNGPTLGSPDVGPPERARQRYLMPLARVLIGALRGSAEHTAVYLDERLRYVDTGLDAPEHRAALGLALTTELSAIGALLGQGLPVDALEATLRELHEPLLETASEPRRLLLIGDCLHVETRAFLVPLMRGIGRPLDVRQVFFSARQPLESAHTSVLAEIQAYRPEIVGISLFTFDGAPPYSAAWRSAGVPFAGRRALATVGSRVEMLRELIDDVRSVSDVTIAVHAPVGLPLDPLRRRLRVLPAHSRGQRRFIAALRAAVQDLVAGTENTILLDEELAVEERGGLRAADGPVFDPDDVPAGYSHTTKLGPALARQYQGLLTDHAMFGTAKALFVDFDHTLWSEVMAEGDVVHHRERQSLLKQLKEAGVLLVALSKNDAASIRWEEMVLDESDFVLLKVNWHTKPENAASAIRELDLAADSFVLLDDNPVERALVVEQVAGVRAVDSLAGDTWRALRRWLDFPSTRQTDESQRRTDMYRDAAARRKVLGQVQDYATMMGTLALRFSVRPAVAADLDRLLELIQRTNQFNTTTVRRGADEVRSLLDDPSQRVQVATLADRFGDLGTIAVAVFDVEQRSFDAVIMSCRAMGFGVELALLRRVIDEAGPGAVSGRYVATQRNGPAADLFARAGFTAAADGTWVLDPAEGLPGIPEWLAEG